jgi:hypothetical protein
LAGVADVAADLGGGWPCPFVVPHVDASQQIVPGVEGPRWFADDTLRTSFEDDGVGVRIRIDYDDNLRRYVCTSFEVFRTPDAGEGKGFVTSEVLRSIAVGHLVVLALTAAPGTVLRVQPNPDGVERGA